MDGDGFETSHSFGTEFRVLLDGRLMMARQMRLFVVAEVIGLTLMGGPVARYAFLTGGFQDQTSLRSVRLAHSIFANN